MDLKEDLSIASKQGELGPQGRSRASCFPRTAASRRAEDPSLSVAACLTTKPWACSPTFAHPPCCRRRRGEFIRGCGGPDFHTWPSTSDGPLAALPQLSWAHVSPQDSHPIPGSLELMPTLPTHLSNLGATATQIWGKCTVAFCCLGAGGSRAPVTDARCETQRPGPSVQRLLPGTSPDPSWSQCPGGSCFLGVRVSLCRPGWCQRSSCFSFPGSWDHRNAPLTFNTCSGVPLLPRQPCSALFSPLLTLLTSTLSSLPNMQDLREVLGGKLTE